LTLRDELQKQNKTLYGLAKYLGLNPKVTYNWKAIPPKHLKKISEFLNISLEKVYNLRIE
jgi:hypothetical protein